jgi:hypothetical protein
MLGCVPAVGPSRSRLQPQLPTPSRHEPQPGSTLPDAPRLPSAGGALTPARSADGPP